MESKSKKKERSRDKEYQIEKEKKKKGEKQKEIEIEKEFKSLYLQQQKKNLEDGLIKIERTNSSFLKDYEGINYKYFLNLPIEKKIYIKEIMKNNIKKTEEKTALELGNKLFGLLSSITKKSKKMNNKAIPNLPFNKALDDKEFMDLVYESVEYALNNKSYNQIEEIQNRFIKDEKSIKELFLKPQINKNIIENSIICILVNKYEKKDIDNNFTFLSFENASPLPLINLPFTNENKNVDINKESLVESAISKIPLLAFNSTMKNFIKNFKYNKIWLKNKIADYINNHEIYFASFIDDIQGVTIHTGDIFINLKYLKEYLDKNNEDKKLIVRTKIIFVIFHEINHGLIREIDEEHYHNFLNNSKHNGKKKKFEI